MSSPRSPGFIGTRVRASTATRRSRDRTTAETRASRGRCPCRRCTWLSTTIGAVVEKYCCSKSRDRLVPAFLAGLRVERHEVVVRRLHVEVVVPDAEAAVGDVRAAARLPVVVPELAAVARVDRPGVVGRRDVQRAIHHQRRALDVRRRRAESRRCLRRRSARCRRHRPAARPGGDAGHPREREVLHRGLVDLLQRAVSPASVVAGVGRPRLGQRLARFRGSHAAALAREDAGSINHGGDDQEQLLDLHLTVQRYAVRSRMALLVIVGKQRAVRLERIHRSRSSAMSPSRRNVRTVPSASASVMRKSS